MNHKPSRKATTTRPGKSQGRYGSLARWALCFGLLAAAGYWFWPGMPHYENFPPSAQGPWVAFGDSLTEGFGASEGHSYPARLSARLGLPVLNRGVSGETTAEALRRLETIAALRPRVVLLCFGGNDSLQQKPAEETFRNLATLIARLHQQGTFVVLLGVRSASLRDKFAAPFARLAREQKVLLVPNLLQGLLLDPRLMSDTLHPNDAGYDQIAERLETILRPLLPVLRGP